MNFLMASDEALRKKLNSLRTEIKDLTEALKLIPVDSALANLSIRAAIKSKERKCTEILKILDPLSK